MVDLDMDSSFAAVGVFVFLVIVVLAQTVLVGSGWDFGYPAEAVGVPKADFRTEVYHFLHE